jgi:hypothetical protein
MLDICGLPYGEGFKCNPSTHWLASPTTCNIDAGGLNALLAGRGGEDATAGVLRCSFTGVMVVNGGHCESVVEHLNEAMIDFGTGTFDCFPPTTTLPETTSTTDPFWFLTTESHRETTDPSPE